jgi:hypothetical protein
VMRSSRAERDQWAWEDIAPQLAPRLLVARDRPANTCFGLVVCLTRAAISDMSGGHVAVDAPLRAAKETKHYIQNRIYGYGSGHPLSEDDHPGRFPKTQTISVDVPLRAVS